MTSPPVQPILINNVVDEHMHRYDAINSLNETVVESTAVSFVCSQEHLNNDSNTSFIIENGLRKRVQAEQPSQSSAACSNGGATLSASKMKSGGVNGFEHHSVQAPATHALPRQYRIESQVCHIVVWTIFQLWFNSIL